MITHLPGPSTASPALMCFSLEQTSEKHHPFGGFLRNQSRTEWFDRSM